MQYDYLKAIGLALFAFLLVASFMPRVG